MKLVIDRNGNVGFDEWFSENDADRILTALKTAGFQIESEKVDYEFKHIPALRKKERYDSIPLNAENVYLILSNVDKDNEEILKVLNIERESTFVITTLVRRLQGEYVQWQKIDHKQEWADEKERLKAFARYMESLTTKTTSRIIKVIEAMSRAGCRQLNSPAEGRFPECKKEFNENCITCQFGKKHITTDADIVRFNAILGKEFTD